MTTRATSDTTRATTEIRSEADELLELESAMSQAGKQVDVQSVELHQAMNMNAALVSVSLATDSVKMDLHARWLARNTPAIPVVSHQCLQNGRDGLCLGRFMCFSISSHFLSLVRWSSLCKQSRASRASLEAQFASIIVKWKK